MHEYVIYVYIYVNVYVYVYTYYKIYIMCMIIKLYFFSNKNIIVVLNRIKYLIL